MTQHIKAGGIVVFWHAGESNRDCLHQMLSEIGLHEFTPELRTPMAVLKDSLEQHFPAKSHLIRATDDEDTFEIVEENRLKGGKNEYKHLMSAQVTTRDLVEVTPFSGIRGVLQGEYDRRRPMLHPTSVTSSIVDIVKSHFKGTPLRPHGGIYWLNESRDSEWAKVMHAFEESGSSKLYTMRIKYDADMVRAVSAAITNEIKTEAEKIEDELKSGDLGKRACESRQVAIVQLMEKLTAYESALGVSLNAVRETVDRSKSAAADAVLLDSVASRVEA